MLLFSMGTWCCHFPRMIGSSKLYPNQRTMALARHSTASVYNADDALKILGCSSIRLVGINWPTNAAHLIPHLRTRHGICPNQGRTFEEFDCCVRSGSSLAVRRLYSLRHHPRTRVRVGLKDFARRVSVNPRMSCRASYSVCRKPNTCRNRDPSFSRPCF